MAIVSPLPFTLQNGTTADATEVMADFNSILNDVNLNAAENGANADITSITGLTTPLAPSQGGTQIWRAATMTNAANAITVTVSVPSTAPAVSTFFLALISPIANTAALSLTTFALGAKDVKRWVVGTGKAALLSGQVAVGNLLLLYYDGTDYILLNPILISNVGTAGLPLISGGTTAIPSFVQMTRPSRQIFTSGSGTYTTPALATWIEVELIGGGGGGGGSGSSSTGGTGGTGGNTTFSGLTGNGGVGGACGGDVNGTLGGVGGATSGGDYGFPGGGGSPCPGLDVNNEPGGQGGNGYFGGGGRGANGTNAGSAGATNSGAGGGGAGQNNTADPGTGGGAGGYANKIINGPAATYSYAVGVAGSAGAAGTGGAVGGAGAAGLIIVTEHYD